MADGWKVISQRQTSQQDVSGFGFIDVMEVVFQTTSGTKGKVYIPLTQYSADRVRDEVDKYVGHIAEVENL